MQQLPAWARNKYTAIAAVCVAIGIAILGVYWLRPTPASEPAAIESEVFAETTAAPDADRLDAPSSTPAPAQADDMVVVYVTGAVQAPDVYRMAAETRVQDVVLAAGGLAANADTKHINLAKHIKDEEHIHIPALGEATEATSTNPDSADDEGAASSKLININTASAAELDELEGIGQAFAARIIEYRTTNGPFKSVDDLKQVKGISATLFEKIAPKITVGP